MTLKEFAMLQEITEHLISQYNAQAVLLHGSRARDDATPTSDYDVIVICDTPDAVRSFQYKDLHIDASGEAPDITIIATSNNIPIWPLTIIHDPYGHAQRLLESTHNAFKQGRASLTDNEWKNRNNYTIRLCNKIKERGHIIPLRYHYLADLQERMVRYWFEKRQRWTESLHLSLKTIEREDPVFYKMIDALWSNDYLSTSDQLYKAIFADVSALIK